MLEKIYDLLAGLPSNAVLREHRDLALSQVLAAQNRIGELQEKVAGLRAEICELKKQLAEQAELEKYIEYKGILFKEAEGSPDKYHCTPRCTACKTPLTFEGGRIHCVSCGWTWRYSIKQFDKYYRELESGEPTKLHND